MHAVSTLRRFPARWSELADSFLESVSLPEKARVLIVDASRESREILRTLLDRQGSEILETAHVQAAGAIADREQPDLIVCDADSDQSPTNEAIRELARQASRSAIPIVVLGTVRRDFRPLSGGNLVSKPYHYAPLLRKIEHLLGARNNAWGLFKHPLRSHSRLTSSRSEFFE